MKKLLLAFLPLCVMFYSCGPSVQELTPNELAKEKETVISVIKAYNKAFQEKNFAGVIPTLSEDVKFFGTDSAEVITSLSQFKQVATDQFNSYDQMLYGDMFDIHIEMDKYGTFASVIYGSPATIFRDGKTEKMFLRVARTLKKESDNWHIITGIVSRAATQVVTTEPASEQPAK